MPGARIWIIEDDASIRADLVEALEMEGYVAEAFAHGREGLEALRAAVELPQLILLDLMMPVMDGAQFLAETASRPEWTAIPVLIVSADGRPQSQSAVENATGRRRIVFMRKPIDLNEFLDKVATLAG